MTRSINEYYNQLNRGFSPTQYNVVINLPDYIANRVEANQKFEFLVKNAQDPGATIGITEAHFRNKTLPIPGDTTFEPWEGTALVDRDMVIREALLEWMKAVNNFEKTGGLSDINDITAPVVIQLLDNNDNIIKETTLANAWCSTVGPIDLSFESKDTLAEFPFTIQYSHIE
jgi:hypothetical protein